ncbi:PhzF family phenazine biosynthesis protein [Arthrobacter sp. HLT1-20]
MEILHFTAFTTDPAGGNKAGVVLDAGTLASGQMQEIATRLGYSESAFLTPRADASYSVRYFAPAAEVQFCGHATLAAAVALAEVRGTGPLMFHTPVGVIPVGTFEKEGVIQATLTSVETHIAEPSAPVLGRLLGALRLGAADLDPALPVLVSFAGNWHPIVPVASAAILASLDYDFDQLAALMADHGWGATVNIVFRLTSNSFESRNPFPPGGVREDSATGSAAASLGGYLRHLGELELPAEISVLQGHHIGSAAQLQIVIPEAGGIRVSGAAVRLGGFSTC